MKWTPTRCVVTVLIMLFSVETMALEVSTDNATEGYLTLSWSNTAEDVSLLLIEKQSQRKFEYVLKDQQAIHVTGLPNGEYTAQLMSIDGPPIQDQVAEFTVHHRDLTSAWTLFSIGATLFIILLITLFSISRTRT